MNDLVAELRKRHVDWHDKTCLHCAKPWPCDAIRAADEIDRLTADGVPRWRYDEMCKRVREVTAERDRAHDARIEAQNPGIDMDEVRARRAALADDGKNEQ